MVNLQKTPQISNLYACYTSHYPKEGLPEGWVVSDLDSLCTTINGLWKGDKGPLVKVGVIRNANFTKDFSLDYNKIEYIDVEQRSFEKRNLLDGDIIVEKSGGSDNYPVGRAILYGGDSGKFSFSNFTMSLRIIDKNALLPKYLYYVLQQKYRRGDMKQMQTQTTGLHNLLTDVFLSMPIPIPPKEEQKRIIDRVDALFTIVSRIDALQGDLTHSIDAAKSIILKLAIHGKLVPQYPSDEPAIEMLKRINPVFTTSHNLHYGDCPEGWTIATVADVFEINPKVQGFDEVDAGFVPMTNICDGFRNKFNFEVRKWAKIKNGFTRFANGDIAVAKISPCLENRKSAIMRNLPNGIGAGTTELNIFRSRAVNPEYGLLYFKSDDFINACTGSYNGVVGQQRVSRSLIEGMQFLLPPMEEQKRIVAAINGYFAVINDIESSLQ